MGLALVGTSASMLTLVVSGFFWLLFNKSDLDKTQRDKDWPMIRRLVEVDYHCRSRRPPQQQVQFWLREARTAALLMELSRSYPALARKTASLRPALHEALEGGARADRR